MKTKPDTHTLASVLQMLRARAPRWLEDSIDVHPTETPPAADLIRVAALADASDVHVAIDDHHGAEVSLRIHGMVSPLLTLDPPQAARLQRQLRVMCGLSTSPTREPEQGHATIDADDGPELDIRLSAVPTSTGASLAIRLLTTGVTDFTPRQLGLDADAEAKLRQWFMTTGGLMLIVGRHRLPMWR